MYFCLGNAPATFQCLIDAVLAGIPHCSAYLDDLVIYTTTWTEHVEVLRKVFACLAEASVTSHHHILGPPSGPR